MKDKLKFLSFWAGILLCALVAVNVWPARVALGPSRPEASGLGMVGEWPEEQDAASDWPDMARVQVYGCNTQYPVVMDRRRGYRVVVWANYEEKQKGQAHDWEKWLSFRSGKKADEQADKDCREWRRAVARRMEAAQKKNAEQRR